MNKKVFKKSLHIGNFFIFGVLVVVLLKFLLPELDAQAQIETLPITVATGGPASPASAVNQAISAVNTAINIPFGGLILERLECTCDKQQPSAMIIINDFVTKTPQKIKIMPPNPSRLYIYQNNFYPQRYALGTINPGGVCRIGQEPDCQDIPVYGIINSMPGAASSGIWGFSQDGPFTSAPS